MKILPERAPERCSPFHRNELPVVNAHAVRDQAGLSAPRAREYSTAVVIRLGSRCSSRPLHWQSSRTVFASRRTEVHRGARWSGRLWLVETGPCPVKSIADQEQGQVGLLDEQTASRPCEHRARVSL